MACFSKVYDFYTPNNYFLVDISSEFNAEQPPRPIAQSNDSENVISDFFKYVPLPFYENCNGSKWRKIQSILEEIRSCSDLTSEKLIVMNFCFLFLVNLM